MDNKHFEKEGIFLGLLSYPYFYDGKSIYAKLEIFFNKHKENLQIYDPDTKDNIFLYKPAGYRMFGSQGLAVLSLVDDYTFFNRHFNKNHIQSCIKDSSDLMFNSTVISGVTEIDDTAESCLIEKAKQTFLREDGEKYHFIGIIRVKINHELLIGEDKGIETLRKIKVNIKAIEEKCKGIYKNTVNSDYISIDCFDNDDMTIIAFSNNLLFLYNFLGEIRSITNNDIHIPCEELDDITHQKRMVEKHVFGSALLCFGYDVNYEPSNDSSIADIKMRCLIETKAGHRDALFSYLSEYLNKQNEKELSINEISKNITGGCSIVAILPLNKISLLEDTCKSDSIFKSHVRRMKVVLMDINCEDRLVSKIDENHAAPQNYTTLKIQEIEIEKNKCLIKKIGVSKLVRERLMALYELYNNSCQNLLQQFYLQELQPIMLKFHDMIEGMSERKERIADIEEALNIEISNMENAIYDRLHIQKHNQPPLEYSGGIQQYLTSFDYAYKFICNVFYPIEEGYVTITGAERASSSRWLFNLNINDIVFPELFITTAWKEVANFAIKLIENPDETPNDDMYIESFFRNLEIWHCFSQHEESFNILRHNIIHSDSILPKDKTCEIMMELMNRELLLYFFKDYLVFHFAFLQNYQMMWFYYFKTMLQTPMCYTRLNEIDRKHFIHILMRLFMVGLLSDDKRDIEFIDNQCNNPFDHLLGDLWMKDYSKTWKIAEVIFHNLEQYGFKNMNECFVQYNESNIKRFSFTKENLNEEITDRLSERKIMTEKMASAFKQGRLMQKSAQSSKDYLICLFYAYLKALYELDNPSQPIKSIYRQNDGDIFVFSCPDRDYYYSNSINILIDPTGGFFVPSSDIRKEYFRLRTVLYRNLWNYRYTNENSRL